MQCTYNIHSINHKCRIEMCTGSKKIFLVPVRDLFAVSSIEMLNYYFSAHSVEKCILFKPIYFKIYHMSPLSIHLGNITTRTRFAGPTGTRLVPVIIFAKLIGNENFSNILKCIGLKSIHFSTKWAAKQ